MRRRPLCLSLCLFFAGSLLSAEDSADLQQILKRITDQQDRLEILRAQLTTLSAALGPVTLRSRRGEPRFRQLYTIRRDGNDLQELIAAPGMICSSAPQWSHDGTMVAFDAVAATDDFIPSQIWIYAAAGPFKGRLRYLCAGNTPSWSLDDSRIAFTINPGNPDGIATGAWIINTDGTERVRLGDGWFSRWSPNGRHVCVHSSLQSPAGLRLFNLETGDERVFLGKEAEQDEILDVQFGGATWTPDGSKLVTVVVRGNEQQLITIDSSGLRESIQIVYREPVGNRVLLGPPDMSPDGKEIAFAVQEPNRGGPRWSNSWLYVVAADGKTPPRLLEGKKIGTLNRTMHWSKDGQRLVFSSDR